MATRKPFLHQPRDVAVGRRDSGTPHIGIAPPLASFDRDVSVSSSARAAVERVLVEHLVEVAHPEEHDGVAVLPLRVEILPHGRASRRRVRRTRREGIRSCWTSECCAERPASREYNDLSRLAIRCMIILALDTTTRAGSAAVRRDDAVLAERVGRPGAHARRSGCPAELMRAARAGRRRARGRRSARRGGRARARSPACASASRRCRDWRWRGPPVVPVSALEALARAGASTRRTAPIAAWMDAQRGEVFAALYAADGRDVLDRRRSRRRRDAILTRWRLEAPGRRAGLHRRRRASRYRERSRGRAAPAASHRRSRRRSPAHRRRSRPRTPRAPSLPHAVVPDLCPRVRTPSWRARRAGATA